MKPFREILAVGRWRPAVELRDLSQLKGEGRALE
jgi:hypothetical protein